MGSLKFKLDKADLVAIAKGAGIAAAGAGSIYAVEAFGRLDFGIWQGAVIALTSVFVNILRKWLTDNNKTRP